MEEGKTKVLHLIDSSGMYGAERVILTLLEELKESVFPGILGCIREKETVTPKIAIEAQRINIPIQYFTMHRGFNPFGIYSILEFVKNNDIKIVHSHGYKSNIYLAALPARKFKAISTVHGWSPESARFKEKLYQYLDIIALKRLDCIVAVSKGVIKDLVSRGLHNQSINLIYNGLKPIQNINKFDSINIRREYGLSDDDYVIGSVGRLVPVKGHSYLIRAMPEILKEKRNCKLVIAGSGPLKDNLGSLIERLNLSQSVKLLGYVSSILPFMAMIDLFVLPSLSEGLPMSLLEAMALGKYVIASAVGGIPEVITENDKGLLIPPADVYSLCKAIKGRFFETEYHKIKSVSRSSSLMANFSSRKMGECYIKTYSNFII